MGEYEKIFTFAAKAGALEGYLYERESLEPLDNWVENIEKMYGSLPDGVKDHVKKEFGEVLRRVLIYGDKSLEKELKTKLSNLLLEL